MTTFEGLICGCSHFVGMWLVAGFDSHSQMVAGLEDGVSEHHVLDQ